jgi:hypothetical protein
MILDDLPFAFVNNFSCALSISFGITIEHLEQCAEGFSILTSRIYIIGGYTLNSRFALRSVIDVAEAT